LRWRPRRLVGIGGEVVAVTDPVDRRSWTRLILAMTADGKIAAADGSAARFGSDADLRRLEQGVAWADAVLFGAGTLRAYGTTLSVRDPALLAQRQSEGRSPQPWQICVSASGDLDPGWRYFQQPVPRGLLTTPAGAERWQNSPLFERIWTGGAAIAWGPVLAELRAQGFERLAVLGGGELAASLLAEDRIDELQLTLCPWLLGGVGAPTPVGGSGLPRPLSLRLVAVEPMGDEVFLTYRRQR